MLRMMRAFLLKDLRVFLSYKFNLFTTAVSIVFLTVFVFLFSSSIELSIQNKYSDNPFNFYLYGLIITEMSVRLVSNIPNTLRGYQLSGVIESIFMDNKHGVMLVLASTIFPIIIAISRICIYVLLSLFLVDEFQLNFDNLYVSLLCIFASVISFISIGLLSSYFTLNFKIANPIFIIYSAIILLFSGAIIPLESIPNYFAWVSYLLPNTYSIEILREINNYSEISSDLSLDILMLLALTSIYFAAGIYVAKMGILHSQKSGNFGHY